MPLPQALSLAGLILEFEIESTPAEAAEWRAELAAARRALEEARNRPPAGQFFLTDPGRRRYQPPKK